MLSGLHKHYIAFCLHQPYLSPYCYYCYYHCYRSMLQLDPRKRPRVEDLEVLSAIQPAMTAARALSSDYKQQQVSPSITACTKYDLTPDSVPVH